MLEEIRYLVNVSKCACVVELRGVEALDIQLPQYIFKSDTPQIYIYVHSHECMQVVNIKLRGNCCTTSGVVLVENNVVF